MYYQPEEMMDELMKAAILQLRLDTHALKNIVDDYEPSEAAWYAWSQVNDRVKELFADIDAVERSYLRSGQ